MKPSITISKSSNSLTGNMLFIHNSIETFKIELSKSNLNEDDMVYFYNRLVEISRHRKIVNKFLTECPDKDVKSAFDMLNELAQQEKQIEIILNSNLKEQNMDYEDLMSQKQKNAMNNFKSLLVMASKRVKVSDNKELSIKDIKFLKEKFNKLDEEGVKPSLVQNAFIKTIDEIEESL